VSQWIEHGEVADEYRLHVGEIARVAQRHEIVPSGPADPALAELSAVEEMGVLARRALTVDAWMSEFSRLPTPTEQSARGVRSRLRPKKASNVEPLLHPDDLDVRRRTLESLAARAEVLGPLAESSLAEQRQHLTAAMTRKRADVSSESDEWTAVGRGNFDGVEIAVGWEPHRCVLVIADNSEERTTPLSTQATSMIESMLERSLCHSVAVFTIGADMGTADLRDIAVQLTTFDDSNHRCYGLVDATGWSGKPSELGVLSDSILDLSDPSFTFAGRQIPLIVDAQIDRVEVVAT
jgi:hypothetical protein